MMLTMMLMMLMMSTSFRLGHPDDVDDAHDDAYDEKYTILAKRLGRKQMMLLPKPQYVTG